jgi:uncharacterized protein YndB with AHSA1/START domain
VRVGATRDALLRCLTEPALVARWQYGALLETTWEPGSAIRFTVATDAGELAQWGEVVGVDAPASLSYTLFAPRPGLDDAPANRFTMRYDLAEEEGATVLTVTMEDPREGAVERSDDNSPVLAALRDLAEGLG